ncbi:tachykinin-3-like protein [Labeo rohita]|uniref:Tachykinin-3-like protein n=1 Tax=Labeo rohita TaxID=84645 RepID=A0A498LVU4_LABRO|nr:tachykinin-3-like protein [Labeo rohita]
MSDFRVQSHESHPARTDTTGQPLQRTPMRIWKNEQREDAEEVTEDTTVQSPLFLLKVKCYLPVKMYRGLVLLFLVLVLETRWSESSCQQSESQRSVSSESPNLRLSAHNLLKRYNDIDYDSFVGLMGRRNADTDDIPPQRKKTGRPWRKDYPETSASGGIFFNKCKLRFRRGL